MKLKDLYTTERVVKDILEEEPYARVDDMYLYHCYCKRKKQPLSQREFERLFISKEFRKKYNIATIESVGRTRRKLQAKYPYLRNEYIYEKRYEQQDIYKDYAIH